MRFQKSNLTNEMREIKMIDIQLEQDERLDDLQYAGLKLVQNKNQYCFSNDAVLLCNFVKAKHSDIIVDLCSGSGVVGILALAKNNAKQAILVEKQPYLAKMSKKTIDFNNLSDKIEVLNCDILEAPKFLGAEKYDVVCSNPPYFLPNKNLLSGKKEIDMAKFEIDMTFDDLCKVASRLLKFGGKFYFVNDATRLAELVLTLKKYDFEPKKIEFVFTKSDIHSKVALFECAKKGNAGTKVCYKVLGD